MANILDLNPREIPDMLRNGDLNLAVIGCGVMGLPLACLYADAGAQVYGVDVNIKHIENLKRGVCISPEPGLKTLLKKVLRSNRFQPTTDFQNAVEDSDIVMIVVSASVDPHGLPDYTALRKVSEDLGLILRKGHLVIQSSTTGPGVTEGIVKRILESLSGLKAEEDFGFVYSPLRGSGGSLLRDLVRYPRIVGAVGPKSLEAAKAVLSVVVKGGVVPVRDIRTAETVKLFENYYRFATLVLSQELAMLCEKINVDYMEVLEACRTQPHCHLLNPSIGVGGHLPKDMCLLQASAEDVKCGLRMLKTAMKVNERLLRHDLSLVTKALRRLGKRLKRSKILVLGLSFKPDVKDIRNSYSFMLADSLLKKGARVIVHDPYFTTREIRDMGFEASANMDRAVREVDCVVIATPHSRFRRLSLSDFKRPDGKPVAVVDFGRILDGSEAERMGVVYVGVGAGTVD